MPLSPADIHEMKTALSEFLSGTGTFGFLRATRLLGLVKRARDEGVAVSIALESLVELVPEREQELLRLAISRMKK